MEILKSDVLVLAIGGHAVHSFPYHLGSRKIDHKIEHENFRAYEKIIEVLTRLK
jgi:putative hydrolase of the HAD superfamily